MKPYHQVSNNKELH